jgi:hypothetical protein
LHCKTRAYLSGVSAGTLSNKESPIFQLSFEAKINQCLQCDKGQGFLRPKPESTELGTGDRNQEPLEFRSYDFQLDCGESFSLLKAVDVSPRARGAHFYLNLNLAALSKSNDDST